jgi:hypothetical protein
LRFCVVIIASNYLHAHSKTFYCFAIVNRKSKTRCNFVFTIRAQIILKNNSTPPWFFVKQIINKLCTLYARLIYQDRHLSNSPKNMPFPFQRHTAMRFSRPWWTLARAGFQSPPARGFAVFLRCAYVRGTSRKAREQKTLFKSERNTRRNGAEFFCVVGFAGGVFFVMLKKCDGL